MNTKLMLIVLVGVFLIGCTANQKEIAKMLRENPEMVTDVIKDNPQKFIAALNDAVKNAQKGDKAKREKEEKEKFEKSFNNPLIADIRDDENIRGIKGAPLTLIEYSDFECPFCKRGYDTMQALMKKYEGKIQFVYKHLPLSFHANAMPAAKYYEAIRIQSNEKASEFHDELFNNFEKIKLGARFFKSVAKKIKVNMAKLEKDLNSPQVKARIDQDLAEAGKFGFRGTPGFLLNGIPVKGAFPPSHFDTIVEELKKRGKLSL